MQTFLPYLDFKKSAECLDRQRLGKQRVEAWQIYRALTEENYGWKNHPIVKIWEGYEHDLLHYGIFICKEWINRGYNDIMLDKFETEHKKIHAKTGEDIRVNPPWLTDDLCASHRSNLLRKNPKHYEQFGWKEPDNLPYVWKV